MHDGGEKSFTDSLLASNTTAKTNSTYLSLGWEKYFDYQKGEETADGARTQFLPLLYNTTSSSLADSLFGLHSMNAAIDPDDNAFSADISSAEIDMGLVLLKVCFLIEYLINGYDHFASIILTKDWENHISEILK